MVVLGLIEWGAAGGVVGADRLGVKPLALKTGHETRPKGRQGEFLQGEFARASCLVDIALERCLVTLVNLNRTSRHMCFRCRSGWCTFSKSVASMQARGGGNGRQKGWMRVTAADFGEDLCVCLPEERRH